jgi:hypothetical protein
MYRIITRQYIKGAEIESGKVFPVLGSEYERTIYNIRQNPLDSLLNLPKNWQGNSQYSSGVYLKHGKILSDINDVC